MRRFDSRLHIPKYILLKEEILNLIKDKQLKPHDKLPSRNELIRDYDVSEITVRKAIDELTNEGYVYRTHGKGTFVAEAKTDRFTIAMMAAHMYTMSDANYMYDIGFMAPIIHSVQQEACNQNANLLLYFNHDDLQIEKQNLASILSRGVDGLAILPGSEWYNAGYLGQLIREGTPVVSVDRVMRGVEVDSVISDNEAGAYKATKTLIDAGFDKIHYFTSDHDFVTIKNRMAGYIRAMAEHGLSYENYLHVCPAALSMTSEEKGSYSIVKAVLKDAKPGFAVFAANTPVFVGVMNGMRELGLNVGDIGLACFDEPPIYVPDNVVYINVLQPLEDMGTRCVEIIMDRLRDKAMEPQHIMLSPKLRVNRNGAVEEVPVVKSERINY
ncbi:GntR family transcriptional regulator [bacterium]|nr:GntR family transcriptional regulator [bacterium]